MLNAWDLYNGPDDVDPDQTVVAVTPHGSYTFGIESARNVNGRLTLALREVPLCGDYPAPCNCDDPLTHGGH